MLAAFRIGVVALGVLLVLATLVPMARGARWWVRVLDFPRLQIAALLSLTLILALALPGGRSPAGLLFAATLAAALLYQGWRILPYTPLVRTQVPRADGCAAEKRLRLLTANVLMTNRRADAFLALVRDHDPDVVIAVETDGWWDRQLHALDEAYPFQVRCPLENTYGIHVLSRLELQDPELRFLVEDDVPSVFARVRLRSGTRIDLWAVHPRPPQPSRDTYERDAELLLVGREVARSGRPAIVAGDLNDVAWSDTTRLFQRTSGLLDPRIGRGPFNTFPAALPGLRWALDHVFHDASLTLVQLRCLPRFGSDHLPVLAELCHRGAPAAEAPAADLEERREASERIEEGLARGQS